MIPKMRNTQTGQTLRTRPPLTTEALVTQLERLSVSLPVFCIMWLLAGAISSSAPQTTLSIFNHPLARGFVNGNIVCVSVWVCESAFNFLSGFLNIWRFGLSWMEILRLRHLPHLHQRSRLRKIVHQKGTTAFVRAKRKINQLKNCGRW